jgi:hypothetical protein
VQHGPRFLLYIHEPLQSGIQNHFQFTNFVSVIVIIRRWFLCLICQKGLMMTTRVERGEWDSNPQAILGDSIYPEI